LGDLEIATREPATEFLKAPLFPSTIARDVFASPSWRNYRADLLSLDASFDVWLDWFGDRIAGVRPDWELERQWALLPDEILEKSPAEINAHLKALRDARADSRAAEPDLVAGNADQYDAPPDLPAEQQPGLQFVIRDDGKIHLRPSGLAGPDDLAEIRAMRSAIVEALDDLTELLEGSNAYGTIARIAARYRAAISAEELSIDLLYSYGVRLENIRAWIEREIESGDYPDLAPQAGEALDSIIALHGPMIYATARGRELVERARAYSDWSIDLPAYKPSAVKFADRVGQEDAVFSEEPRKIIPEVAREVGEGPHAERSTQVGHAALTNVLIAAAKGVQAALLADEVEKAVRDGVKDGVKKITAASVVGIPSAAVMAAGAGVYLAAPHIAAFLLANKALLCEFALLAGADLSWLPHFLHWLKRQQHRLELLKHALSAVDINEKRAP
jgi:hypothetical protein